MKKNFIILASALFLASGFASCQKTYTCVCTPTDGSGAKATSFLTKKTTKKQAEEVCTAGIPDNDCKLN